MNFLRLNYFLKLINNFRRKKNTQSAMWQPPGAPCVMLTSSRGQPYADVIMTFDDISIDTVNVDQVNDQRVSGQVSGVHGRWGPPVSLTAENDMWARRVRLKGKRKEKKVKRGFWAQRKDWAGRLGRKHTTRLRSVGTGRLGGSA